MFIINFIKYNEEVRWNLQTRESHYIVISN